MLPTLSLFLILLVHGLSSQNLESGRFYRIFGNRNVQTVSPYISGLSGVYGNVQISDPNQYLKQYPHLFDFIKNVTVSRNVTREDLEILTPFGSADLELNLTGGRPFRNFFKNFWGGSGSNVPTFVTLVNGGARSMNNPNEWFTAVPQLPRRRLVARKSQPKRRILVRNLTPTQLRNLQRLNVPVYQDLAWQYEPTWLDSVQ